MTRRDAVKCCCRKRPVQGRDRIEQGIVQAPGVPEMVMRIDDRSAAHVTL
jgi:hypothetical protein